MTNKLIDFVTEFTNELAEQIKKDDARWGDTWKHRPREGQEGRAFARFNDYYDQFRYSGIPIPWLKVAGEALIAYVRENHPEELIEEKK